MASIDFNARIDTPAEGLFARFTTWMVNLVEARARARGDEIARLNSLSDAELAALGIRRENIVQHVFRDIWYV